MKDAQVSGQDGASEAFVWSPKYETGIELVDLQHRGLVALINRVGLAQQQSALAEALEPILDELSDYARDHFAMEHRLMQESGLDAEFVRDHVASHGSFVKQLGIMRSCLGDAPERLLPGLLRYLITWLAEHILVEDQAMAWQVRAVGGGMSAEAASAWASGKANPSHDALVEAMHRMYAELAQRNSDLKRTNEILLEREQQLETARRELAHFNAGLGARVAERTAEVYEVQLRLQQEYDAQRSLSRQLEQTRRELEARTAAALDDGLIDDMTRELDEIERQLSAPAEAADLVSALGSLARIRKILSRLRSAA